MDAKSSITVLIIVGLLAFCFGKTMISDEPGHDIGAPDDSAALSAFSKKLVSVQDDPTVTGMINTEKLAENNKGHEELARSIRNSFKEAYRLRELAAKKYKAPEIKVAICKASKASNRTLIASVSKPKSQPRTLPTVIIRKRTVDQDNNSGQPLLATDGYHEDIVKWVAEHNIVNKASRILQEYGSIISSMSSRHDLPGEVIASIIAIESAGQPRLVSFTGDTGLMQLSSGTIAFCKVSDPYDPYQNIRGGSYYFRYLLDRYGYLSDPTHAFLVASAAYNRGPGRVDELLRTGRNPINDYARRVLCAASQLSNRT